jgi:ABC-type branched-subunit amino acid transport system substrate-binding protein
MRKARRRSLFARLGAAAVASSMLLVAAACGDDGASSTDDGGPSRSSVSTGAAGTSDTTAPAGEFPPVDQPGVTAEEIRVGGVTSETNPLQGAYASAYDGVRAYFAMVNSKGGIYGRKLRLVAERDDQVANNRQQVQALLDEDDVFAVLPVATIFSFSGADVVEEQGVPTFGWNINDEWKDKLNAFGNEGVLCFGCEGVNAPWLSDELDRKRVAVLAYNSTANSRACADGIRESYEKYPEGGEVVFFDNALGFGTVDFSVQVGEMVDEDVDFVTTCMDLNAVFNLAKEMRKQRLDAIQYLPNGYDHEFMEENGRLFEGSIVRSAFAPFETKPRPKGLKQYLRWMKKRDDRTTENATVGWINAATFVEGLRLAGPDFTRQKVIDGLNQLTDWDADGLIAPIDWTTQHVDNRPPRTCNAYSEIVEDGEFEPVFGKRGKPFICFREGLTELPEKPGGYE